MNTECELFKVRVEHNQKLKSGHPWQRTIKSKFSHVIKHCHNSVRNAPGVPPDRNRQTRAARVTFTVTGNRYTKEFIYCSNLVRGICTYKWKSYEPPVIKGLDRIEWLEALRDLKAQYGGITFCLDGEVAVLYDGKFLGGVKELKDLIETKYIYYVCLNYYKEVLNAFASHVKSSGRPCVYMHIAIKGQYTGTFLFMLYSDICPRTCENFLRLCQTKQGGYSGTPVHRIVKDGWIQCGGFGLKSTSLECENFAVPHDRRGVLCMANDGRDIDCSTQFFVLLQPSPWMAKKYVAFGQLIDGNNTLAKIENVPTWYESPKEDIVIQAAGIVNLECQDIKINKSAFSYIQGHIENLVTIEELFWELLMEQVFLEIEFRAIAALEHHGEGEEELDAQIQPSNTDMRETQRFIRKKDTSQLKNEARQSYAKNEARQSNATDVDVNENNDFDVEDYDYEPEELYSHVSLAPPSLPPKIEKLFYIPLTDIKYPGEVDSTYDLKKFLKGDYCLETDVDPKYTKPKKISVPILSDLFGCVADEYDDPEEQELNSDDEQEIRKYLKEHGEIVSFAGRVVRNIAKGAIVSDMKKINEEELNDECVRKVRLASCDVRHKENKRVSISAPVDDAQVHQIKRRQTGFVRPEDLAKIKVFQNAGVDSDDDDDDDGDDDDDDDDEPKSKKTAKWKDDDEDEEEEDEFDRSERKVSVSINVPENEDKQSHIKRRQTGFVRNEDLAKLKKISPKLEKEHDHHEAKQKVRISIGTETHLRPSHIHRPDDNEDYSQARPSVMARLYDDCAIDDDEPLPTLKDYKPLSESDRHNKNPIFLTKTTLLHDDDVKKGSRAVRPSIVYEEDSFDHIFSIQHGKKVTRKISSDYVKTMDQMDKKNMQSLRTLEFARTRPAMTISEYQIKNRNRGLRLPGDTPLYGNSTMSVVHDVSEKKITHVKRKSHDRGHKKHVLQTY